MKFQTPLLEGKFLKRYKRFFADFERNGDVLTAHCANTGSMKSCNEPGSLCRVSEATDPERKLRFTLEMIQAQSGAWVGVNTSIPNKIVKEALERKLFAHWQEFDVIKPEFKLNKETRLDFCLSQSSTGKQHFIEVKNVTLAEGNVAMFPDAVTERGQKHLRELMELVEQGHSCEILFTIQRNDCEFFSAAKSIDPEYDRLLILAIQKGVRVTPVVVCLDAEDVYLTQTILPLKGSGE